MLLPDFGGSYLVWGACVVFFQAVLFLGYLYAYIVLKKIGIKAYQPLHLVLFLLPLLCFPGRGMPLVNAPNINIPLVLSVFWHLVITIGPVFFALSTTSVILQSWLAGSHLAEKDNPYALYALSNLGSFAALVTYPFLFEAFFDLSQQLLIWSLFYFLLVALNIIAIFSIKVNPGERAARIWSTQGISWRDSLRWFLFSAAGVIMFLSVTNIFTYEIAPIPLLWVVPLCIYLASFVLNFKRNPWAPAWIADKFYLTFAWSVVMFFITTMRILPFILELVIYCLFLFHICMFIQQHLFRTRPADTQSLPFFYLVVSAGGFFGGMLTTWVMPLVSVSVSEYLLALAAIALALAVGSKYQKLGWRNILYVFYICFMLILWPLVFRGYNFFGLIIIFLFFKVCYRSLMKHAQALFFSILMVLFVTQFIDAIWGSDHYIYRHRNYYGVYKVYYEKQKYVLMHGATIHGAQFKDKIREREPLTYYHKDTPVGKLLAATDMRFNRIGLVGLGTGALASYAKAGQEVDYFEIDQDVYPIAHNLFSYLKYSEAKINFISGDARLTIEKTALKRYDILIVDAFSGDAIPAHLLTTDAINEYRRHLADGGIIVFHISNRYLDFIPVLFSNANYLNAHACYKDNREKRGVGLFSSSWFALTWDVRAYYKLVGELKWVNCDWRKNRLIRPWTDEYSNEFSIIRFDNLFDQVRYFKPFYW
jgi:spermidine synthase